VIFLDKDLKEAISDMIKAELSPILERLEAMETRLNNLERVQDDHSAVIDVLSYRSISFEADMKYGKKTTATME
jgi:tetrahydromethanopterin S-methyltransferase subunit B